MLIDCFIQIKMSKSQKILKNILKLIIYLYKTYK